jgi:glycosidase
VTSWIFAFEFDLALSIINAFNSGSTPGLKGAIQYDYDHYPFLQFGTFLTNHDQNRVIDNFSGNLSKMKVAAATYLTLPGIPFVYYGEEIGMTGSGAMKTSAGQCNGRAARMRASLPAHPGSLSIAITPPIMLQQN